MADDEVTIEVATELNDELKEAVQLLVPQLSSSGRVNLASIEATIRSEATELYVARVGNRVVGILTLATFTIPTGVRCWVEDVVVDNEARGRGIASALVAEALKAARLAGATTVDLTSRPSREAANRLYQRLGFKLRETNVYRVTLEN